MSDQPQIDIDAMFPDSIMGGQTVLIVLKNNQTPFKGVITRYSSQKGFVTLTAAGSDKSIVHRIALSQVAAVSCLNEQEG